MPHRKAVKLYTIKNTEVVPIFTNPNNGKAGGEKISACLFFIYSYTTNPLL
jgi:hypothetical protein